LSTDATNPLSVSIGEACNIVDTYRRFNLPIVHLWQEMEAHIVHMVKGETKPFRAVVFAKDKIILPSGLAIHYHKLSASINAMTGRAYSAMYETRKGPVKLYGGLITENAVQALARCVVAEQMLKIAERYRIAMMTHDEVVFIAPQHEAEQALEWGLQIMKTPPDWAPDLPVNAEGGFDVNYSK
jgi:DNA polymerase